MKIKRMHDQGELANASTLAQGNGRVGLEDSLSLDSSKNSNSGACTTQVAGSKDRAAAINCR